ncbi:MAG: TlyA family RNA methyltransferase [Campylobacterota bacterium]|nr:TlyA family RNA methyltransferase [Campylobacterota bacterium]
MRLDIYVTKQHNIQSRNKAQELIKSKKVFVNGKIVTKSSFIVENNMDIIVDIDDFFVSRSAKKLKYFLDDNSSIKLDNLDALDIGSSTGGFTQVLLLNNVKSVTCVDVGSNQLHQSIKNDNKIIVKENTDIREFNSDKKYDIVTCDVSFISILYIIEDINRLANDKIIILYKPQFEVGKGIKRDKNGVVLDTKAIDLCRDEFLEKATSLGWGLVTSSKSKVLGKSGNSEELFYFNI